MSKIGNYPIPFDQNGKLLTYPDYRVIGWKDNHAFKAALQFDHFSRGRSSALAIFKDQAGRTWPMFLTCLSSAMPHLVNGRLEGEFTFTKRGQNYSILFLGPSANT